MSLRIAVTRELAATNGGPGLTAPDLAVRLGSPVAVIRNTLSELVFSEKSVTCGRDGCYKIGSPAKLLGLTS